MEFPHLSSETLSKVPWGNPGLTEGIPGPRFTLGSEGIAPEAEAAPSFTGADPQPCPVSSPEDRPRQGERTPSSTVEWGSRGRVWARGQGSGAAMPPHWVSAQRS